MYQHRGKGGARNRCRISDLKNRSIRVSGTVYEHVNMYMYVYIDWRVDAIVNCLLVFDGMTRMSVWTSHHPCMSMRGALSMRSYMYAETMSFIHMSSKAATSRHTYIHP
jgi:hypothetical protein